MAIHTLYAEKPIYTGRWLSQGNDVIMLAQAVREGVAVAVIGSQGPLGGETSLKTAGEPLSALRVVRLSQDGSAVLATNANPASCCGILGITETAAVQGGQVVVRGQGELFDAGLTLQTGKPVFLTPSGQLTTTAPVGILVVIGWAVAINRIVIRPEQAIL